MKFRKIPVVIDAVQYKYNSINGMISHNYDEIRQFINDNTLCVGINPDGKLGIPTLEGTMYASPNDWIIKGVNGEFYPRKPDIFKKTYEPVDGDN